MRSYRDYSITTKLNLLVLLASGVALSLATACFVWNDISMIRASKVKQMSIVADVLGSNSTAALNFQESDTAKELLSSLRAQPEVEYACIYNTAGVLFASYQSPANKDELPPQSPAKAIQFVDGEYLDVVQPIEHKGESLGTIFLHVNLMEIRDQTLRTIGIMAVMAIISLVISTLLATRFQRVISTPILKLSVVAQRISANRDYGLRVAKTANDELGTLYDQFNAMLEQIQAGEAAIQQANDQLEAKIEKRTAELSLANQELSHEISERVKTEQELEVVHNKLVDSAHRAGMAEIATGVLHNVGNVLNSINVSATLVSDKMRQSKVTDLIKATDLIKEHPQDLGAFITTDPKGKHLPGFLCLLADHLSKERTENTKELELLTSKIGHVKAIIATQQTFAGYTAVREMVDLGCIIEDALNFNLAFLDRHQITIVNECPQALRVCIDKQKVLQILVNIIKNAKESFNDCDPSHKRIIRVWTTLTERKTIQMAIADNGIGVLPENLTRIFSHGFTTKRTGHGFGLHSCANAAKEMGGSLTVQSNGLGTGATFFLEIPCNQNVVPIPIMSLSILDPLPGPIPIL